MIKDFIERNKSVFVIGFVTLVIFIAIIVISEIRRVRNNNFGPELIGVEESTETIVNENNSGLEIVPTENTANDFILEGSGGNYSVLPESSYFETDANFGTMRVEYTENGFIPVNAKAVLNQKVKWVNKTNQDIFIKQKNAFFREFKDPMRVPANGMVEFRMYRDGMWSYEEQISTRPGSITILKP